MTVMELFQSGKLREAVQALSQEVRNNPLDAKRRIFLFELLCFAGEYDRAEKHLDLLAEAGSSARLGALLYRSAIHAEKDRQRMFAEGATPMAKPAAALSGVRNGEPFERFADADERFGGALELFVAGSYAWISLQQIASIEIAKPQKLRDLLWIPAIVTTSPAYKTMELGEVLLPVLSPLSWKSEDDSVRLGRSTQWTEDRDGDPIPMGQKMFIVGEREVPILELGKIEFPHLGEEGRVASA
jgi:type VI secretion system protein ImpE